MKPTSNPTRRRRPRLARETIRTLDLREVAPDELEKVAGGGYKASCCCTTQVGG